MSLFKLNSFFDDQHISSLFLLLTTMTLLNTVIYLTKIGLQKKRKTSENNCAHHLYLF